PHISLSSFLLIRLPPSPTLLPYTTLFRSLTMSNLPSAIYLGMAVSSHTNGVPATAQFRDLMQVSGGTIGTVTLPIEPAGPSSRRDRKSTRLNSSHQIISYAVFCLKKKNN